MTYQRNILPASVGLKNKLSDQSDPEDEGPRYLQNVSKLLSDYMASHLVG
jgi:hypothetical protein